MQAHSDIQTSVSSTIDRLRLPVELIQKIIGYTWELPLTPADRITLMTSLPLVNKTTLAFFVKISYTDVYIPCFSYLEKYFSILSTDYLMHANLGLAISTQRPGFSPNALCRSITVIIAPQRYPFYARGCARHDFSNLTFTTIRNQEMSDDIHQVMAILSDMPYVPNLDLLYLQYMAATPLIIIRQLTFLLFDIPLSETDTGIEGRVRASNPSSILPTCPSGCLSFSPPFQPMVEITSQASGVSLPYMQQLVSSGCAEEIVESVEAVVSTYEGRWREIMKIGCEDMVVSCGIIRGLGGLAETEELNWDSFF